MAKKFFSLIIALALLAAAGAAYAAASPEPSDKTIKREIKLGRKSAAEIEKHVPRVLNPSVEAKLSMIAARLIPHMQRELEYEVRILEMEQPNAFSLPGGMTYITTGMLDFLKSEDEIAAVLCHEFVHADRAHGIVQARRNNRLNLLTLAGLIAATQAGEGGAGIAAMAGGKTEDVAKLTSEMYAKKADCDAENLAVLTAGYNYLAEKEMEGANDPANLSDYIEKALECYDAAMKSDAESAKEAFEQLGKANIEKELKELKSNLEQAQAAEQALLEQING